MKTAQSRRPVNLLLNSETVAQARHYTHNLSATVDALLGEYVARQAAERASRQQRADAVADAWNRCLQMQGCSFADDFSTL